MKKKILVIEDERATRSNLLKFLESEGYTAIGAENGRLGIQSACENLPDLIICDILMPELDGYDVLTELQKEPETAAIPFIFLTVATDPEHFRQGMQLGADDYLSKPATSAELRAAINSRLKKQEAVIQKYTGETEPAEMLEQKIKQLEQFISAKNSLMNYFLQRERDLMFSLQETIEQLHQDHNESDQSLLLSNLQQDFTRILALINQVSELQQILTPDNIDLLQQFNFLQNP
jgi:two-component system, OmpR family, alkaline phosphatase synthesis response regulator PhoP